MQDENGAEVLVQGEYGPEVLVQDKNGPDVLMQDNNVIIRVYGSYCYRPLFPDRSRAWVVDECSPLFSVFCF